LQPGNFSDTVTGSQPMNQRSYILLAAAAAWLAWATPNSFAQIIHPTTTVWSIWTNGTDPGYPDWFQQHFDDSAWPTGIRTQ